MLEEILENAFSCVEASNQPIFSTDVSYEDLLNRRSEILNEWKSLPPETRANYKNQNEFDRANQCPDLKDPELIPAKNYYILSKEISERLNSHNNLQLLPIDTLDYDESVIELAENLENINDISGIYRIRKMTTGENKNSGISAEEAGRLKNCFSQGRELYLAGRQGSLLVKPLNFFYALTAYSYGVIILNNPIRYSKGNIPGSHGMSYLPDAVQAQFGGDSARGTFSDLVTSFPTQLVKTPSVEFSVDCSESVIAFYNKRFSVSLGLLMSMVPEMSEYYKLTTGQNSRCFPLEITTANNPRGLTWEFHIGDGESRPSDQGISRAFDGFSAADRFGKTVIMVPASRASSIKACIYTDVRGKLWYIDNPFFPVILPEIALHFLITSIFSNIMRYRPDEWGSVLLNDVRSGISLISRHYFSSFQRKFLILILRHLSRYIPYAS